MSFAFNPLTGNFDLKGSGGGGASYIDGEVATYADLPLDGSAALNSAWLVRTASGVWPVSRKQAGIYIRTATGGSSRDADYTYAGTMPDVFSDAQFTLYGDVDSTKNVKFNVDAQVGANQTRVITVPNKNITLDDAGDSRTPTSHAASHAAGGSDPVFDQDLNTDSDPQFNSVTATDAYLGTFEVAGVTPNRMTFSGDEGITFYGDTGSATRTNLGAAASGSITSSGLTQATARLIGRTSSGTGAVEEITVGTGLMLSAGELSATASGGIGGGTGSTDNSILRSDGTGGSTLQASGLVIEDTVTAFTTVTGDAATDIITATGSAFANGQRVRFTSLTGGAGLNTTTNYFVINVSGATFQLSTTDGGSASLFTTNITAGTLLTGHAVQTLVRVSNVASDTNSALVLSPKGGGAFVLGPQPDASSSGGNARGVSAVELQMVRTSATAVASGERAFIGGGANNTGSGPDSVCCGGTGNTASGFLAGIFSGRNNTASGDRSMAAGDANTSSGTNSFALGQSNTASATNSVALGERSVADRRGLFAHASSNFAANGDAQRIRAVLRCKTTTNAAVEMALDGSTTYLTIPSGKVIFCNIKVVGVKSDGSAVATYERQYAAKNVAGTSSEVYAAVTIGVDNASSTSLEVATVDAGDYIRIRPTGITSETWRWVASVDAVEVAYGS